LGELQTLLVNVDARQPPRPWRLGRRRTCARHNAAEPRRPRGLSGGDAGGTNARAPQVVAGDELDEALTAAVTCCILAAAGPQRSRVLANLYKDERSARLPVFGFLEKVYLERILRPEEVRAPPTAASPVPSSRAAHPRGARRAALPWQM